MLNEVVREDLDYITSQPLSWDSLFGKAALITGANGHLGSFMVETLLYLNDTRCQKRKIKVVALVRDEQRAKQRFAHHNDRDDLVIEVRDFQLPVTISERVDFIIHTASTASSIKYMRDPTDLFVGNVVSTYHLLNLAVKNNASHFLYFSSGEVYGRLRPEQIPVKENEFGQIDPARARSSYAECKRVAETMMACWHAQYGLQTKIVRPCHTYGPGVSLVDGPVFADFIADILNKRPIKMKSQGTALRTFCYLADATLAFYKVLLDGAPAEAYNVANDDSTVRIYELADLLAEAFSTTVDRPPPDAVPVGVETWPDSTPDTQKLRSLGWTAKTSLVDGFRRTLKSFGFSD